MRICQSALEAWSVFHGTSHWQGILHVRMCECFFCCSSVTDNASAHTHFTNLRQTYHSHEESLLPAQSFFTRTSSGRPVYEPSSDLSQKRKSSRDLENERIRILFERQKEQILADFRAEIQRHEFQADSDRRSIQELNGMIDRVSAKRNGSCSCRR